jgi:hypothetical protein
MRRNDCGNCLVVVLMVGAILAGVFLALATPTPAIGAAPVPKGPPPKPIDPIQPGYQWNYSGHLLVVTAVDGQCVAYRCINRPSQTWPGLDGWTEICRQSKERTKTEAETYKDHPLLPWEFEF